MKQLTFTLNPDKSGEVSFIELNKLLKFMQLCENGAMANALISEGLVQLNGAVDTRKRAKIRKGDIVIFEDVEITIQ